MATLASSKWSGAGAGHRFFLVSALLMAALNVAGFSLQFGMGRSSFSAPPIVHAHALVFFGWVAIYLAQTALAARRGSALALHRKLGWVAAGWMVVMVALGTVVTVRLIRAGHTPFFFQPAYFLVMNPVGVLAFAGLSGWAIAWRRRTDWHKRLHLCGMAMLMGPALGRLLPVPLLIPFVGPALFATMLLFPLAGIVADRRRGTVHPAWIAGIVAMASAQLVIEVVAVTPLGPALYATVTRGSPGAAVPPLAYPRFPPG